MKVRCWCGLWCLYSRVQYSTVQYSNYDQMQFTSYTYIVMGNDGIEDSWCIVNSQSKGRDVGMIDVR